MRVGKHRTASHEKRLLGTGMPGLRPFAVAALLLLFIGSAFLARNAAADSRRFAQTARPSQAAHAPAPQSRPMPEIRSGTRPEQQGAGRPGQQSAQRPGQQHLPEWWSNHRAMTPSQREDALRREPGFRNLPSDQQQRLINRLHTFEERSPEQQQRILQRNENFERLSPERKQEVRGASQALSQMSPDRQQVVRHAFQQLRRMPPQQRQQLLNSGVYGGQFSSQERTVLGNLLAIEPYETPRTIPQPYFGRP